MSPNFETVAEFEIKIAEFFGAPYAVAVDSCTHGLELCLRLVNADYIYCPRNTYLSVPMLADKLKIKLIWDDEGKEWNEFYNIYGHYANGIGAIYDAAVLWRKDSYLHFTSLMCLSFQYQKHLSLGRGGMILCPNKSVAEKLKKMSYDGRVPGIPWREQDVDTMGYHYYMTPETAQLGLDKLQKAIETEPRKWTINDWPDISKMKVFQ